MKKIIILLVFLALTRTGLTQGTGPNEYHFNRLSIKNGLPEEVILAYLQDGEGYVWIGTQGGLVRYDGYTTRVYQFGVEDLNRASVSSIFEDRTGRLWVGTWLNGIYRYNRENDSFYHYGHSVIDENSVGEGQVVTWQDDRAGNIWMLLNGLDGKNSVNLFDPKNNRFKHFSKFEKGEHYINASEYYCLLEDRKGRFWIGTNNGFCEYVVSGDHFIPHFATPDSSKQKRFDQLKEDPVNTGMIWMTVFDPLRIKGQGVWQYNTADNTVKVYQRKSGDPTSLGNDSVFTIQKDSKGVLWFGTFSGLSAFNPISKSFSNYIITDKTAKGWEKAIFQLCEDKTGNFWCGNQNRLFIFENLTKTFNQYTPDVNNVDDIQRNSFTLISADHSGTPWLGTAFQGMNWLNKKRSIFSVYKNNPGQAHYFPGGGYCSFAENKDGTFWVWSSNGLYRWYPVKDSFEVIKEMKNHGEKFPWHFSTIAVDQKGAVWCGSFGKGLFYYDPKTHIVRNFRYNKDDSTSLANDYVSTVLVDHLGILWIGTFGTGLCSFNERSKKFKRYPYIVNHVNTPNNNALDDNVVFNIYEDKEGTIWLGTNGGGLNKFNRETGTFTSYQNQSPGFMTIANIFEDSRSNLWVGTHVGGLFQFDRKTGSSKKFGEKDGLLYGGTIGLVEDNESNLWIASQRGISILNILSNKITHINVVNGLPEEPENNLNFFKASDGRFFLPCNNGFISFDPAQLKPDTVPPIIHIESLEFSRPQLTGIIKSDSVLYAFGRDKINLHYNENRITFNYIGLQYQNSALNHYAYKLDGYDKDWIQAGVQRKVTYTNLSPGTYIFHVKAANSDGVWNSGEKNITVMISPPWWSTWWAYIVYGLALTAAVWVFVDYRAKALKRENLVLEEKITYRTSQLNQSLEDLKSTQTQLIQSEKMASLGELTAGIAHEIQNPLNFVNNFSDVNTELIAELEEEVNQGNLDEVKSIARDIRENEKKINHHGKRADGIVKGMLQHAQITAGRKEPTDINKLSDEYLKLAYHGLRARDRTFDVRTRTEFDESIGKMNIVPQDIGRVVLNMINNAFYAVTERRKQDSDGFEPNVTLTTKGTKDKVEIIINDNGNGIPPKLMDKIFQPFYTTKPAGEGTGLGLSLSYDIIKAHGGEIKVVSNQGEGTTFTISLSRG